MNPESELDTFLAKFTPEVEGHARVILDKLRARLPGAVELVDDNYNALAIGFGANEKMSGVIFSIALYPRWVSLFFFNGPDLPDPHGLLKGEGNTVRHIVLSTPDLLDSPEVQELIGQALLRAVPPIDPNQPRKLVIKSVSANQRPRRPTGPEKR